MSFIDARIPAGLGGRFYGVYPAIVVDNQDPDDQCRVRVRLTWSPESDDGTWEVWARLATMMAGPDRGSFFVPDPDDEVLISFGGGDPSQPFIVGALWNGQDAPPTSMSQGNDRKVLKSRNGVTLTLTDTTGAESFAVETPGGQRITLQDGPGSITIEDGQGNTITLDATGVTVQTSANVTINGSQVEVNASMLTVNAGMSKFSGAVQCPTLIATTVVGTTYTPGAGNIW